MQRLGVSQSLTTSVESIHEELVQFMESLRLVWYFAGGPTIRTPPSSNHEAVVDRLLLAERGHPRFSDSLRLSWNVIDPYRQMPLSDAIALLLGLGKLPGAAGGDPRKQVLWTCLSAFQAATVATRAIDKFVRAFPPLDLLATTHYEPPKLGADAEAFLKQIHGLIENSKGIFGARGARVAEVLRGGLKVEALRDRFEMFVKGRLPDEADFLVEAFARFNRLRNDVFHEARFDAIDSDSAEAVRALLERCLKAELTVILDQGRSAGPG